MYKQFCKARRKKINVSFSILTLTFKSDLLCLFAQWTVCIRDYPSLVILSTLALLLAWAKKKKTTLNDSDGKSRQGLLISWYTMLCECWIFTTCKPLVNWGRNIMVGFLLVYDRELLTSCSWPWSSVWLSETRLHHTWLAMNENTISTVPPSFFKSFLNCKIVEASKQNWKSKQRMISHHL